MTLFNLYLVQKQTFHFYSIFSFWLHGQNLMKGNTSMRREMWLYPHPFFLDIAKELMCSTSCHKPWCKHLKINFQSNPQEAWQCCLFASRRMIFDCRGDAKYLALRFKQYIYWKMLNNKVNFSLPTPIAPS